MAGRFAHAEHGGETDVGALEQVAPFGPGLATDYRGQRVVKRRPAVAIHLFLERRVGDLGLFQQERIELRLQRRDRDPSAVRALVGVVEVGAAVQEVGRAFVAPVALVPEAIE